MYKRVVLLSIAISAKLSYKMSKFTGIDQSNFITEIKTEKFREEMERMKLFNWLRDMNYGHV